MENSPVWPPRPIRPRESSQQPQSAKMTVLAMTAPSPPAFRREHWDAVRPSDFSSRPRSEAESIILPSIRDVRDLRPCRRSSTNRGQMIPSVFGANQDGPARQGVQTTSPPRPTGPMTPPEYDNSPNAHHSNKRRRPSMDDMAEMERARQVPRLYQSPSRVPELPHRLPSPSAAPRSVAAESWGSSAATSPYSTTGPMSTLRSPMEANESAPRPPLPSLPPMTYEREARPPMRMRGHSIDEHPVQRPGAPVAGFPMMETGYRPTSYGYYAHPTRMQSLSVGAVHPFERSMPPAAHYQDIMRFGEMSNMGMSGENKTRRRRGNLPKETTDKLRAWFVEHRQHPYPTEDEKQDLMKQTGLQLSKSLFLYRHMGAC